MIYAMQVRELYHDIMTSLQCTGAAQCHHPDGEGQQVSTQGLGFRVQFIYQRKVPGCCIFACCLMLCTNRLHIHQ